MEELLAGLSTRDAIASGGDVIRGKVDLIAPGENQWVPEVPDLEAVRALQMYRLT